MKNNDLTKELTKELEKYEKQLKKIQNLAKEFWKMREKFKSQTILFSNNKREMLHFDYPSYFGLPKRIYSKLSSDFVDSLQGDFFYELQTEGIKKYKEFFHSEKVLYKKLIEVYKIYGN